MKLLLRTVAILALISALPAFAHDDKYLDAGGIKIRYIDTGKGPTVVLLHGGTSKLESWTDTGVVANLEKDFRVIAFDARGHGKSDKPREPAAYGRQQALDVVRILDALKIDRAHIVGFSLGGSTVAQLLTLHPERFLTAVQVAAAGRSPKEANDPRIETEAAEIARDSNPHHLPAVRRSGGQKAQASNLAAHPASTAGRPAFGWRSRRSRLPRNRPPPARCQTDWKPGSGMVCPNVGRALCPPRRG